MEGVAVFLFPGKEGIHVTMTFPLALGYDTPLSTIKRTAEELFAQYVAKEVKVSYSVRDAPRQQQQQEGAAARVEPM